MTCRGSATVCARRDQKAINYSAAGAQGFAAWVEIAATRLSMKRADSSFVLPSRPLT
jgi:hypothetical protein